MHGRKGDDLSSPNANDNAMEPSTPSAPSASGSRTRRTGLLTVMERAPGMFLYFIILFLHNKNCFSQQFIA